MIRTESSYSQNDFSSEFRKLISQINPKLIVEFGIGNGYSLQAMLDNIDQRLCRIHAYDLFEKYPYSAADQQTIKDKFKGNYGLTFYQEDFFIGYARYPNEHCIDLLHIDVSNDGKVYEHAMQHYWPRIAPGGFMVLEGGTLERDQVEWMIKYNKVPINPIVQAWSKEYKVQLIDKFPGIVIVKKT